MTLDKIIATTIGELTIAHAKQALIIETLCGEIAKRDGRIAELQEKIEVLKVQASEPELPIEAKGNGHAETTTH